MGDDSPQQLYRDLQACRSMRGMQRVLLFGAKPWRLWWFHQAFDKAQLDAVREKLPQRLPKSARSLALLVVWHRLQTHPEFGTSVR
jgi:hypothetical protein